MRTLHLLRHAKSSWADPTLDDRDRPLTDRGRRAAGLMASHLRYNGARPGLVVCSSALRARQTLDLVAVGLGLDFQVEVDEAIYASTEQNLWRRVRQLPDRTNEAMLIGHNPGMHELAGSLASHGDDAARERLRVKLPTCALVTVVWAADSWTSLRRPDAVLHGYVTPHDL